MLAKAKAALEGISDSNWTAARRPKPRCASVIAEKTGLKLGAVAQPICGGLTRRTTSPGVFDVLAGPRSRTKAWRASPTAKRRVFASP